MESLPRVYTSTWRHEVYYYIDTDEIPSSRAVKIPFLSFTCEDIGVAMVTNKVSELQESIPFLIEFSKFSRRTELLRTLRSY